MKTTIRKIYLSLLILAMPALLLAQTELIGAWESGPDENHITLVFSGPSFSAAVFNKKDKTFISTWGGVYKTNGNELTQVQEFNTLNPDQIGKEMKSGITIKNNKLVLKTADKTDEFTRIDNGTPGQLAGAWLMSGRMTDSGIETRKPGPRKTMKILSGTRFQWIAYNVDTKEFFGTGGGTYTTENGKYTESIEFFSRDNTRVGMKLQFDFSLTDGDWRHKGLSSKGAPIDEIWSKREKIEKP